MSNRDKLDFRQSVLERFGATGSEVDELLAYNQNVFDHAALDAGLSLPLDDEPFVPFWEEYAEEAKQIGVFEALRKRLVQFNYPIQEGISTTEEYQQAVRKGIVSENVRQSGGLELKRPERLQLLIHQTPAGKIPLLITSERDDFVALIRAFTCKNEPKPIPASQGAAMMAGYNNWDRIARLKEAYQREQGSAYTEDGWVETFQTIMPQKHLYQDKFILLSGGTYYSGVTPEQIGLDDETWCEQSLIIRREHECTHYFTKRVLSSMQNKVLDELIADYAGIATATGEFNADWFLTFVGLEHYPTYREGGRLQNYKGTPPLSDGAFVILQTLVHHAAKNLETYTTTYPQSISGYTTVNPLLLALTYLTLEELASEESWQIIQNIIIS
jgi:hypothetical protein